MTSIKGSGINSSVDFIPSNDGEKSSRFSKIKGHLNNIANTIIGIVKEFFVFFLMAATYFVPFKLFDPTSKSEKIKRDENGVSLQQPVILVHGYLHNSSAWIYHKNKLEEAGYLVFTVDLGAIPTKSIDDYAKKALRKRVLEVQKITNRDDAILIGHSMGGVVSSHYALNVAEKDGANITDVITLSSPLEGTKLSPIGVGPCVRDMTPGSKCLEELCPKKMESSATRFYHVASKVDAIIRPYYSALNVDSEEKMDGLDPTTFHIAPRVGHCSILYSKSTVEKEIAFLQNPAYSS